MTKIRYIGAKPVKTDSEAGTKTVWNGNGDVQDVPAQAVPALLRHPTVWEVVATSGLANAKDAKDEPEDKPMADLSDKQVREIAAEHDIKVDGRLKGAKLRAAVEDGLA